jgi:glycosyltransferase involved in cell wall biosynthesis
LVSVLTPSFNQGRWLADNLRSVASQSYPALEHVVMDGGSTDDSLRILGDATPSVAWESAPDQGQSDAINKAFARSRGDIIGWLNSDDAYFSRDAVARAVEVFEKHPEVGVVYGHAALVNGDGTLLHVLWTPSFARSLLRAYNVICQPTVFVRRSAIGRPFLVDPGFDYMMDRELWLHLSTRTTFRRLDEIIAIDRHHLQRKSYTRLDLATSDDKLLRGRYRIVGMASNRVLHRAVKVALRVAGLSKILEASRGGDASPIAAGSLSLIAMRQVAQLRRWMPSGDTRSRESSGPAPVRRQP